VSGLDVVHCDAVEIHFAATRSNTMVGMPLRRTSSSAGDLSMQGTMISPSVWRAIKA